MNRLFPVLVLSGLAVATLSGCATDQKYAQLDAAYRSTLAQNQDLEAQLDALNQEIRLLQQRLSDQEGGLTGAEGTNAELRQRLAKLMEDYRALESRLNNMDVVLNPETDAALRALAESNPGVLTYDAKRGMLRFSSDLTFASGSTEVQPAGKQALDALARVLGSPSASVYDIRIVGHTDSVPISSATAARHPTNTHLSAHRAISVRDVLATDGISRDRMEVGGWGEYRPAVPNRPGRAGTPENRRVEVFLVASGSANIPSGVTEPAPSAPAPSGRAFEPVK